MSCSSPNSWECSAVAPSHSLEGPERYEPSPLGLVFLCVRWCVIAFFGAREFDVTSMSFVVLRSCCFFS